LKVEICDSETTIFLMMPPKHPYPDQKCQKLRKIVCQTLILLFIASESCIAQHIDSLEGKLENLPGNFFAKIQKKYASIEKNLSKKTTKYLAKMQRQEKRLQRNAAKADSSYIPHENVDSIYAAFAGKLSSAGQSPVDHARSSVVRLNQYNPFIDTLSTSLAFLKKYKGLEDKIKAPTDALDQLKSRLNQTDKIKEFIAQRKEQLKEELSKYTHIPSSLKNEYANIQKTAYYYSAQVKEYRDMLKDPKKIEEKALSILNQMPFFQKFMKENSQLASLFRLPDNSGSSTAQTLAGLQTRASVQGMIQQRIASGGPNAMAQVQQNLAAAQAEIGKLKDKISQLGGGGSDLEMPDFKPNSQKTKPLSKRLEYSANVQFTKSNNLLPSTANIGLGIGYKLDDKRIIGVGMDYSEGMGTIQHISFTSQGIGLRSYLDWKIKKQIYITGGYEMNYNSAFKNIEQLKDYEAWQRSALIGLSKKYKISKKVKGNMQLLYDFLANKHVPISQPVIFRVGYNF
jgi:hypothetical protein